FIGADTSLSLTEFIGASPPSMPNGIVPPPSGVPAGADSVLSLALLITSFMFFSFTIYNRKRLPDLQSGLHAIESRLGHNVQSRPFGKLSNWEIVRGHV